MLRIKRRKSRGRPYGPSPLFLADCVRLDATALLAKSRGARLLGDEGGAGDFSSQWTLQWAEDGRRGAELSLSRHGDPAAPRWCPPLVALSQVPPPLPRAPGGHA